MSKKKRQNKNKNTRKNKGGRPPKIIEGIDLTPELLGEFVMETVRSAEWHKKDSKST